MFEIRVEPAFQADYQRVMRRHPQLRAEFKAAVEELIVHGRVPASYRPHFG